MKVNDHNSRTKQILPFTGFRFSVSPNHESFSAKYFIFWEFYRLCVSSVLWVSVLHDEDEYKRSHHAHATKAGLAGQDNEYGATMVLDLTRPNTCPCLHCCCYWYGLEEAILTSTLYRTAAILGHQGCSSLCLS